MRSKPANDGRQWTTDDWWYACRCGSTAFHILWRDNRGWLICSKCEADNTMEVFG
jgi:hypothetical protein